uniref:PAP-associated domain-containing protein n=1 Tax=Haemonchus contortus TaxID=6289 RepID=A0A7I4YXY6_HAECO
MGNKNQRRKQRRHEQNKNNVALSERFDFVRKLAEKWGKKLQMDRTCDLNGAGGTEQHTVHVAFGDIPFIVLGAKGIGRSIEEADSNCAWNLISFFQSYLSRQTMASIRRKWATAESEIDEAIEVCRSIENALNSEQFCQLKTVPVLDANPPEKAWARQLRLELRKSYGERKLFNAVTSSRSTAANGTIFTQQAQSGTTLKRKLSDDIITIDDLTGPTKRNKACQAEPSTNGIARSSLSVICLDDDDDCEEVIMRTFKSEDAQPSLNISTTSSNSQGSTTPLPKAPPTAPVNDRVPPSFSESSVIGVHFNPAAAPIPGKIREYRERYSNEFNVLDAEIWKHYECNRQTEEVYNWKMEVRNRLLAEFQPAFPHKSIELYAVGSTVNGCGSYNSDMDLCLCIPMDVELVYSSERIAAIKTLRRLNTIIRGKPSLRQIVRKSEVIPAKVPIIKMALYPPYEELDLDININNVAGIYNSHLIHYYSLLDQRFPAVCLLVKHWAITNGIADAATGSFNSYSLILLVLHYFQCGVQPAVLPNLQHLYPERFAGTPPLKQLNLFQPLNFLPNRPGNKQTIGELLVGFFHYYASFDFENVAISIRHAHVFPRRTMPPDTFIYKVFIEEPFDRNNTARCVTKAYVMDRIQRAFRQARDVFSKQPPSLQRIKVTV